MHFKDYVYVYDRGCVISGAESVPHFPQRLYSPDIFFFALDFVSSPQNASPHVELSHYPRMAASVKSDIWCLNALVIKASPNQNGIEQTTRKSLPMALNKSCEWKYMY